MAQTTVLALFKDKRDAEAAVRALKSARFDSARLGVVDPGKAHVQEFGKMAVAGVGAGTAVCGVLGVGLGIAVAGVLPGTHAWLSGGWFVPFMFGLTAAATGALAGMLISQSVSRQNALYYEEELTLAEIGQVIGVCESRVSQLRSLALSRLRSMLRDAIGVPEVRS